MEGGKILCDLVDPLLKVSFDSAATTILSPTQSSHVVNSDYEQLTGLCLHMSLDLLCASHTGKWYLYFAMTKLSYTIGLVGTFSKCQVNRKEAFGQTWSPANVRCCWQNRHAPTRIRPLTCNISSLDVNNKPLIHLARPEWSTESQI